MSSTRFWIWIGLAFTFGFVAGVVAIILLGAYLTAVISYAG